MIDNKVEEIRKHLEAIADILGIEKTKSNENTPLRIAKMYCNELFKNRNNANSEELNASIKLFDNDFDSSSPVCMSGIHFNSVCEHHWLPFFGTADVIYVPKDKIIGLSKIPRVIKYFSQKPQLQERLTNEIGEYLVKALKPRYLRIELKALHTCVMCRGAESECNTSTLYEWSET